MRKIYLLLLLAVSFTASSQALDPEAKFREDLNAISNIQQLFTLAKNTKESKQLERHVMVVERLVVLRPHNPNLKFALAKAYAMVDDKTKSYNTLVEMQNAGLSYPTAGHEEFKNITGTPVYDYIEEGMEVNGKPYGAGKVVGKVSEHYSGMLFENIAYDAKNERFLLASIRSGAIYELNKNQEFKEIIAAGDPATGPWGAVDLVIDEANDLLWVASSTMPQYTGTTQANFGQSMITKYQLSSLEILQGFALKGAQEPMLFSALHLSEQGNLYFVNLFNNQTFKVAKDADSIEALLVLKNLSAIKSITTNSDENILYVSDYDLGVFAIDLETQKIGQIGSSSKGFTAGYDDVFYHQGDLVVIQNGVSPARIMRLVLQKDVLLVNMFPLEAGREEFAALSKGVLSGNDLFYIANSQWDKMELSGLLSEGEQWEELLIMQTDVKFQLEEQLKRQKKMEEVKKSRGIQ